MTGRWRLTFHFHNREFSMQHVGGSTPGLMLCFLSNRCLHKFSAISHGKKRGSTPQFLPVFE